MNCMCFWEIISKQAAAKQKSHTRFGIQAPRRHGREFRFA